MVISKPSALPVFKCFDQRRLIADRCGGNGLDRGKVRQLGPAAVDAPCAAMRDMNSEDRRAVVEELKEGLDSLRESGRRGALGKTSCARLDDIPMEEISDSRAAMETVSRKDLQRRQADRRGGMRELLGLNEGVNPDLTESLVRIAGVC